MGDEMNARHEHDWRHWPYSADTVCLGCGYMVVEGIHYPRGKWVVPPIEVSRDPSKCQHASFAAGEGGFTCRDCGTVFPNGGTR